MKFVNLSPSTIERFNQTLADEIRARLQNETGETQQTCERVQWLQVQLRELERQQAQSGATDENTHR